MSETYSIVVSSPFPNYDFFAHKMRQLCGQWSISFFMVDETWVKEFFQKLQSKEISVRVLFDLTADQTFEQDIYLKVAREVKRQGGVVIDDPDVTAKVAHKGHFHKILVENKIPVPETIVVDRSELENFKITDEMKSRLGVPFVVKPAWGDSAVGVNLEGQSEADLLKSAELAPRSDAFLLQKRLKMKTLGKNAGWFRLYHVCGDVIPCWWHPTSHEYRMVTPSEIRKYKLSGLNRIMKGIARISKMRKFSSEICLHEDGKLYAVDYINADPDMNPRSFYASGVPDEIVRHIVWLLFDEAMRIVKRGQGFFDEELTESESDAWLERRQIEQRQIDRME